MENVEYFAGENLAIDIKKVQSIKNEWESGKSTIVYASVTNTTNKSIKVEFNGANLLNAEKEQRSYDYGDENQSDEMKVLPGACFSYGYVFTEKNHGKITKGWTISFKVTDETDDVEYDVSFRLCKMRPYTWEIIDCEINHEDDADAEDDGDMDRTTEIDRLKECVERIEAFEEKLNIRMENISFNIKDDFFKIFMDIYSRNGDELPSSFDLNVVCYDDEKNITSKDSDTVYKDDFMGYDTYEFTIYQASSKVKKIRIYPTKH